MSPGTKVQIINPNFVGFRKLIVQMSVSQSHCKCLMNLNKLLNVIMKILILFAHQAVIIHTQKKPKNMIHIYWKVKHHIVNGIVWVIIMMNKVKLKKLIKILNKNRALKDLVCLV